MGKTKIFILFIVFFYMINYSCHNKSDRFVMGFPERLEPIGRILDLTEQGFVVWDLSPIYDSNGKIHVFFTRVPNSDGNWFQNYKMKAEIVHATATRPEGPYTVHKVIHRGRGPGHWDAFGVAGPRIYKVDNKYALFFTAYEVGWPREKLKEHIGLLISDDLQNWRYANNGQPILSPDTTSTDTWDSMVVKNAAFVKNSENNQYWLYYCGFRSLDMFNIGLAVSNKLEGPYIRNSVNPVINATEYKIGFRGFEDPLVWFENDRFCMLVKDLGYFEEYPGGGCYFESKDGVNWSEPMYGYYGPNFYWGESGAFDAPQILKNDLGEPEYLFLTRTPNGKSSGFIYKINR
jgi:hypothetical protein